MTKKPLAIFTMVRNESYWLPRWLKYYGRTGADLYVLDHESDDGSTDSRRNPGVFFRAVHNPATDDAEWMRRAVEDAQHELLQTYRAVIYAEVDEFLVPDPVNYDGLADYLGRRGDAPSLTATGFDICALPDSPLLTECADPVLYRGWRRNDQYDKTLICRAPMQWAVGFHRPAAEHMHLHNPDPGLLLVHLHYACRTAAWDRLRHRMRGREPAPGGLGFQNKYRERAPFDRNFDEAAAGASPVPDWLLGTI